MDSESERKRFVKMVNALFSPNCEFDLRSYQWPLPDDLQKLLIETTKNYLLKQAEQVLNKDVNGKNLNARFRIYRNKFGKY